MEDKRDININNLPKDGWHISVHGKLGLILIGQDSYKIVNLDTNTVVAALNTSDIKDLYCILCDVCMWFDYHNITQK